MTDLGPSIGLPLAVSGCEGGGTDTLFAHRSEDQDERPNDLAGIFGWCLVLTIGRCRLKVGMSLPVGKMLTLSQR